MHCCFSGKALCGLAMQTALQQLELLKVPWRRRLIVLCSDACHVLFWSGCGMKMFVRKAANEASASLPLCRCPVRLGVCLLQVCPRRQLARRAKKQGGQRREGAPFVGHPKSLARSRVALCDPSPTQRFCQRRKLARRFLRALAVPCAWCQLPANWGSHARVPR